LWARHVETDHVKPGVGAAIPVIEVEQGIDLRLGELNVEKRLAQNLAPECDSRARVRLR